MLACPRCLPFAALLALCLCGESVAAEPRRDRFGDPLPEGAVARLGTIRLRSEWPIRTAVFAPDGKSLATIGNDLCIRFWDVATGKEVRSLSVKVAGATGELRFSADGKTLLVGGAWDSVIHFIDTMSGAESRTLTYSVRCGMGELVLARDGRTLVALHEGRIVVWDVAGRKPLHEFKELYELDNRSLPFGLPCLTADGKQLVLPRADGSLRLVDTASGKEIRSLDAAWGKTDKPRRFRLAYPTLSPDGRYLAFLDLDSNRRLALCDLATGKRVRQWDRPATGMGNLTFTPNSRSLAATTPEGISLFDIESGKEIRHLSEASGTYGPLIFAPDGRTLATFGYCTVYLWDVAGGRPLHAPVGHNGPIGALAFLPDGKRLISADGSRMIVWDVETGQDRAERRTHGLYPNSLRVGEDNKVRFLTWDRTAHQWDADADRDERSALRLPAAHHADLSPDGRTAATLTFTPPSDWNLYLHDLRAGVRRPLTLPKTAGVDYFLFSPDGRLLVTVCRDGPLRLWDATGKLAREWKAEPGEFRSWLYPVFAADGRSLAVFVAKREGLASISPSLPGEVRVYEMATGRERLTIAAPETLCALTCSADGRLIACGHHDGRILVHETGTGKRIAEFPTKQRHIDSLAFSRQGRLLASGGKQGTILIWKMPEGRRLPAFLKREQAAAFWQTLADADAARAHVALVGLVDAPAQAIPFIKERFTSPRKDSEFARLIAKLDDESFKVRERAMRELAEAGPDAADALHQALANKPSAEARRRIQDLLNQLDKEGRSERLRCVRAIEVMERIGTPQAKDTLRGLVEKDIGTALREEIRATLRRMDKLP